MWLRDNFSIYFLYSVWSVIWLFGAQCSQQSQVMVDWPARYWCIVVLIRSLSNDDDNRCRDGNENVTRKYIVISFVLLRDYFNSLNFYKNGELFRNQIGRSRVQVKTENEKFTVVRSRSSQNLKCKTHVQSDCFCSLNLLFCGVVVAVAVVVP